jgi:hypothetical protein
MTTGVLMFGLLILILFAGAAAFLIHVMRQREKLHTLVPMTLCPSCHKAYGKEGLATLRRIRGTSIDAAADDVVQVECPHCAVITEYRVDGQLHQTHARIHKDDAT